MAWSSGMCESHRPWKQWVQMPKCQLIPELCQCTLTTIYHHIGPRLEVPSMEIFGTLYDVYS